MIARSCTWAYRLSCPANSPGISRLRTSRYTYVRNLDGPWMLFDDEQDPYQMDNLVGKPDHAVLAQQLNARLQAELKRIGDDFRSGPSYVAEWGYQIGSHGSVPYNEPDAKPQTPRRGSKE